MTVLAYVHTATEDEPVGLSPLADNVRRIAADIKAQSQATERGRRVSDETIEQLRKAGLFRAFVPRRFGGDEADPGDWAEAVRIISAADTSTGWVAGVLSCHTHAITFFSRRAQEDVWATGPDTIICTSGAPVGRVREVPGGLRLSGRFRFSSGSDFAGWALLGFMSTGSKPGSYMCLVPAADYTIDDTWFTSGLRGSGSKDIVVEDAFVPTYRCLGPGLAQKPADPDLHDGPLYRLSFLSILNLPFGPVMLGGAEGAMAEAMAGLASRTRALGAGRMAEYAPAQIKLAESVMDMRTAKLLLESRWRHTSHCARLGIADTPDDLRQWRSDDTFAAHCATRAVDRLVSSAGGSAQYETKPLQRYWRDLHMAGQHVYLEYDGTMHVLGRHMLGFPPDPTLSFS